MIRFPLLALLALMLAAGPARAAVDPETAFVLNSASFLFHGFIVMFMSAGFAMLEAGLVRSKNTATICLKNIAIYAIAGLMFYLVGYNLMYVDVHQFIGKLLPFYNPAEAELALINADADGRIGALATVLGGSSYASMSDWFFQMVFVATTASIISGTLAERVKLWPFLIFVVMLTGFFYPITGSWVWGKGWLYEMGFKDFAGSTLVHSVGGWCALTGALILGPRIGRFGPGGRVTPMPGSNLPLATLGCFVLWFGWFGFNGGSQLAMGSAADVSAIAIVYANTNLAAAAGVVVSMLYTQIRYKKVDLTMAINGAIAGLVAITAGPDLQDHRIAMLVGGIGGILCALCVPMLDKLKIDDVVGAIPAHLVAGIWGTLAVGIFGAGSLVTQLVGILAIGGFMLLVSAGFWLILKFTLGIRVDPEHEHIGLDQAELGLEAYPEFGKGSQKF